MLCIYIYVHISVHYMVYVYVLYIYIYLGIEVLQDLLNAEFPSAGATDGDATWKSAKSKVHHAIPRFQICMLVLELMKSPTNC